MTAPSSVPTRPSRARLAGLLLVTTSLVGAGAAATATAWAQSAGPYVPPANAPADPATTSFTSTAARAAHEVWLVDQSDTATGHGGRLEIHDGAALRSGAPSQPEVVDLAGATTQLCEQSTGVRPTRPHMLVFSPDQSHAVLAFVASGHTVFFDAARRTPVACFRSEPGAAGARQAHAAVTTPDGRYVLVANQNGKRLERIRTDFATGTFTPEPAATLDLATGTTPQGLPRQTPDDAAVRPDNAPICPFVPSTGFPAFVSLRGGGAFAVDPTSTPMTIVAEYPAAEVPRDGCGFTEADGWVYANGGLPAPAVGQTSGWAVHRFPLGGATTYRASNPPSTPAVQVVQLDGRTGRDAHGMTTVRDDVWAFDRLGHALQVYRGATAERLHEVDLRGPWGDAPAPDIADQAPDGFAVYVATRGPSPLSGAHAARGDAPGLLVIDSSVEGGAPVVRRHVPAGRGTAADPHGLAVRLTAAPEPVAPVLDGPAVVTPPSGSVQTVSGRAEPGASVALLFRARGQAQFEQRRALTAGPDGRFSTTFLATDDHRYYAEVDGVRSQAVLSAPVPVLAGPATRVVPRGTSVVLSGRGTPGSPVVLSFRRSTDAAGTYPVTRTVQVGGDGTWQRTFVADRDHRLLVQRVLSGPVTARQLVEVR